MFESVKNAWYHWNIRGVVLFSLSLQIILILLSPFRKRTADKVVVFLTWSGYLLADSTATFAIGLIFRGQTNQSNSDIFSPENRDILAFWAPFLLLHLGGPDTITAFALEDNELWLRHFLTFAVQGASTGYVFFLTFTENKLIFPTFLLFLAGIIKYLERTFSLFRASKKKFRASMLRKPDAGPNYARYMGEYASKMPEKPQETKPESSGEGGKMKDKTVPPRVLNDVELVQEAYVFFKIFKGLVVDLVFSLKEREKSRDFFKSISAEDALKLIEVELNFIYGALYTKVVLLHSMFGKIFRSVSFISIVSALLFFRFFVKKHSFNKIDVKITYGLLFGAIGLDVLAFLMAFFSDWTVATLGPRRKDRNASADVNQKEKDQTPSATVGQNEKTPKAAFPRKSLERLLGGFLRLRKLKWSDCNAEPFAQQKALATCSIFRRWSGYISGYNLMRYCLRGRPTRIDIVDCVWPGTIHRLLDSCYGILDAMDQYIGSCYRKMILFFNLRKVIRRGGILKDKVLDLVGLKSLLDEMIAAKFVSRVPLTKELWEIIFKELEEKSQSINDDAEAQKIYSARGDWVLQNNGLKKDFDSLIQDYILQVDYDQSVLMWHIATELLYNDEKGNHSSRGDREYSKVLSDYMLYLLIMEPTMTSQVAGIANVRFQDTCAEAEGFFRRRGVRRNQIKKASRRVLEVDTLIKPSEVKGDRSTSVLFNASMLAKELQKLKGAEWEILSKVWVEMLSYAASHCNSSAHAQQLAKGGQLITFVWMLMAHFGLLDRFKSNVSLLSYEES